jgi:curved DNA-binding protein CbpA
MSDFTYYDMLGISAKATEAEIKDAYKERARYYHPDVTSLAPEIAQAQLKVINEAYSILGSAPKRKEYDEELLARKELTILGEISEVVEQLLQGKFKVAVESIKEAIEKVPESDIPRGLLASAYHMRAMVAFESQKYDIAKKLLKQALAVEFEDPDLKHALECDLAVVEHRIQAPVPLTDADTIALELGSRNKHSVLRAIQALSTGLFPEDPKIVQALQKAAASPYRDVRIAALRVLMTHDPKHEAAYEALSDFYNGGKDDAKIRALRQFTKKSPRSLAAILSPLVWEPQEKIRIQVIEILGKRGNKDLLTDLYPLLWSKSGEVPRKALWAILRIQKNLKALLGLMPKTKAIAPAQRKIRSQLGDKSACFPHIASFWEIPQKRAHVLKTWMKTKNAQPFLPYAMVAFYDKMAGATDACREFLSHHGDLSLAMMIEASKDEDWMIRLGAIEVLKDIKSPQSCDTLLAALSDSRPLILKGAIEGLGKLGDSRAIDALRLLLRNEDKEISNLAQTALNEIRGQKSPSQKKREKGFDKWTG